MSAKNSISIAEPWATRKYLLGLAPELIKKEWSRHLKVFRICFLLWVILSVLVAVLNGAGEYYLLASLFTAGFALLFTAIHWSCFYMPHTLRFTKTDFRFQIGRFPNVYQYELIESINFQEAFADKKIHYFVEIEQKNGTRESFGLRDKSSRLKLLDFFAEHKIVIRTV